MKKTSKVLALTASLVALAGVANAAATYDINIYGSSAQFNFWKASSATFMGLGTGSLGCTTVSAFATAGNDGITSGTNCTPTPAITGFSAGSNVNIRVSKKASYDGIWAVMGQKDTTLPDPADPTLACQNADGHNRRMMAATDKSLGCYKVTVGASDVKGESFLQASQGLMFGYKPYDTVTTDAVTTTGGYNPYYDRSTVFVNSNGLDTSSITKVYSPVIVPFAFYVNNGVLMADGTTHVTNLTRLQAVSLFSGGIKNWSDFGPAYKSQHATICLRHAGSGSHATLDGAVMNGGAWGSGLVQIANNANEDATGMLNAYDNTAADVIFNDGTGDELQCVSNYAGAVGYADADAAYGKASSYPGIFPNGAASGSIAPINYQGAAPTATNIINGVYDFWTKEQMYVSNTATTAEASIVNKMQGYLNNSAHLVGASYEGYWASLADLGAKGITKGSDYLYPSR